MTAPGLESAVFMHIKCPAGTGSWCVGYLAVPGYRRLVSRIKESSKCCFNGDSRPVVLSVAVVVEIMAFPVCIVMYY
jgi:hypothetical protein